MSMADRYSADSSDALSISKKENIGRDRQQARLAWPGHDDLLLRQRRTAWPGADRPIRQRHGAAADRCRAVPLGASDRADVCRAWLGNPGRRRLLSMGKERDRTAC